MKKEEVKKINVFEKISLWWKFDGRYMHRNFAKGIKNLWRWFPVIWEDRDWDHDYIYTLIRTKLNFQSDYIRKFGNHLDAGRDAERMRLVSRLIELEQEGFYTMEYMGYHDTKYDFIPTDETKKLYRIEDTLISESFDEYFKKYPRQYKRVLSGEINRYKRPVEKKDKQVIAMEIAHENQERCRNLIFKIMNDHIQRWWD